MPRTSDFPTLVLDLTSGDGLQAYSRFFETMPLASFLVDPLGAVLMANPRAVDLLGYAVQDEVVGRPIAELLPGPPAALRDALRRLLSGEKVPCRDLELPRKDGASVRLSLAMHPVHDESGQTVAAHYMVLDVTAWRETEDQLRESEERFRLFVDHAAEAFYLVDAEGRIVDVNRQAAEDTGYTREELVAMRAWDLSLTLTPESYREFLSKSRSRGPATFHATHRRKDGSTYPVEIRSRVFPAGDGYLALALARDLSDLAEAETEIRRLTLEKLYLEEEIETRGRFHDMVGRSAPMRDVFRSVEQVAGTNATVLIMGETGTGKELVARAVHKASSRSDRVFVALNCAALAPGLVESELFGHEKGAFTGAAVRRIGRFEAADGGTIFLDEVGDLPLDLQVKLLRVIEEGRFERVGGTETLDVDVRVIAATNLDLAEAVRAERFRADLCYRLYVFPIRVPALRERLEDLPLLVEYFVDRYARTMGRRIDSVPPPGLEALRRYDWPGNVRELQNVIERAVILSRTGALELGDWLATATDKPSSLRPGASSWRLHDVERRHLLSVLERTSWQVAGKGGAAGILDLKPSTLRSRLKKLGIARPD